MRPPESLPSLFLFLLATFPSPPCAAARGSSSNNNINIKDLVDAVVHPLNPRTLNHLLWPRLDDLPGGPPPPPGDDDHPHPPGPGDDDHGPRPGPPPPPRPDGPPDPAILDAVVGNQNLQSFTDALGGIAAGPITESNDAQRRYKADGNTFPTFIEAAERTCEVQANDCTTKANSNPQPDPQSNQNANNPKNTNLTGTQSNQNANNPKNTNLTGTQTHPKPAGDDPQKVELTVDKCEAQRTRCLSFQSKSASVTAFPDQTSTTTTTSSTSTTLSAAPTVNATTTSNGATMTVAGAPPPLPMPGKQPPGGPPGMGMMPLPPPPGAGPTGTQLINLGPDPQFPLFDLLCDV
ncbi:hypothetical protein IWX90DRAFT_124692 [Phyllosticta citrichinensis]|uniref:Uncharacterized protein n=1 Tax=Phyllosticta citrichinensis TaxID=1130410 RepID=A0ABR1Y4A6_9PEZI